MNELVKRLNDLLGGYSPAHDATIKDAIAELGRKDRLLGLYKELTGNGQRVYMDEKTSKIWEQIKQAEVKP